MKTAGDTAGSALSVFTQFWRPGESYRLLLERRRAGVAMIASVLVIAAAGYLPALFIDWEDFESGWAEVRLPELLEEGMEPARADSVLAGELEEIREMAGNLPMARLVERSIMALLAALAAFGLVYAVEGRKVGGFIDYLTSSVLSQSAYMLSSGLLLLTVTLLRVSPGTRLNLSVLVPVGTADPSRMHVFIFRFLESFDIPSAVCLLLWGTGLAAMMDRNRSWGIRLVLSVYILGVLLISLPVMFAPSA